MGISIFLEYVAGGTLKSQVKTLGKLPVDLVENYMNQILKGLAFIHENNVIHRDLKPANVLISTEGRVKLADFGTAFDLAGSTESDGMICGTPAFVSPEVVRKELHTTATDIWSLGVIIFNMLTGDYPFKDPDHLALLRKIRSQELRLVFPVDFPYKFREIIRGCLQYEAVDRPTAKQLLENSWDRKHRSSVCVDEPVEIKIEMPRAVPRISLADDVRSIPSDRSKPDKRSGSIDSWDFNETIERRNVSRSRG